MPADASQGQRRRPGLQLAALWLASWQVSKCPAGTPGVPAAQVGEGHAELRVAIQARARADDLTREEPGVGRVSARGVNTREKTVPIVAVNFTIQTLSRL